MSKHKNKNEALWPSPPSRPSGSSSQRGSTTSVLTGAAALAIGIGATVLQDGFALDAEKLVSGGVYWSSTYRQILLIGGVTLASLGLALVVVGAIAPRSARPLAGITVAVLALVIVGGVLGIAANESKQQASDRQETVPDSGSTPEPEAADVPSGAVDDPSPNLCRNARPQVARKLAADRAAASRTRRRYTRRKRETVV